MTSEPLHPVPAPGRRTVVAAVGATGLAVALTACGSDNGSSDSSSSNTQSGANASGGAGASSSASSGGGATLAKTADIPEGGGKIFKDHGLVVTQPTAGTYKAFSSKCTHQGCAVSEISNGVIICPCHKSEFSVTDGSVKKGPATQPLPAEKITVSGDSIMMNM